MNPSITRRLDLPLAEPAPSAGRTAARDRPGRSPPRACSARRWRGSPGPGSRPRAPSWRAAGSALLERVGLLGAGVELIIPRQTAVERGQDAAERGVGRRVRPRRAPAWCRSPGAGRLRRVGAGHLGVGSPRRPAACSCAPCARAEPKATAAQSRWPSRPPRRAGCEDPRLLGHVLAADVAQLGVLADHELDDGVQHRLAVLGARQDCSQTSASAPSSRTISVRRLSAVPAASAIAVEQDRRLPHPRGRRRRRHRPSASLEAVKTSRSPSTIVPRYGSTSSGCARRRA